MKVKSILKLTTAVKIEITGANFVSHNVNYLKDTTNIDNYGNFINYPAVSVLPDFVLNATIDNIDTNSANNALTIRTLEAL